MTELQQLTTWPPAYRIKKHRLARHVKLRASSQKGLEITIPTRFNLKDIPSILEEHKVWILKQLSRLESNILAPAFLPDHIHLEAINEHWKIEYVACQSKFELIQRPQKELVLVGRLPEPTDCRKILTQWIKRYAIAPIQTQLHQLSVANQLEYQQLTIRDQKTLWGSCTSQKSISLNYKLLFLPLHLLQHVMIHELAHTKHLNHSMRFWKCVESMDPNWRMHRQALKTADQYIPNWLVT